MKQYKLIKEYPGSPKLDTIVSWTESNDFGSVYCYLDQVMLSTDRVEKYPEFWKKVVAKDYEILAFRNKNKPYNVYTLEDDGKYHGTSGSIIMYEYCASHYDIYSMRCLITGNIFTLGDKVKVSGTRKSDVISEFKHAFFECFQSDGAIAILETIGNCGMGLRYLSHEELLLVTTDGVNIYKGDTVWYVLENTSLICSQSNLTTLTSCLNAKIFSSEKATKDYIDLNKPRFSKQQLLDLANTFSNSYLVKNKIMDLALSK
jgi:hypothetical protein